MFVNVWHVSFLTFFEGMSEIVPYVSKIYRAHLDLKAHIFLLPMSH